jgi:hypothetical protein
LINIVAEGILVGSLNNRPILHIQGCKYKYALCEPKLTLYVSEPLCGHSADSDKFVSVLEELLPEKKYYFIFDCPGEDALGHWVYESFMFHSLFSELKEQYPTLQIVTSNKKKYVKSLLKFFDFDDDVLYEIINTQNNVCFFPPIIAINRLLHADIFIKYIDIYANSVKEKLVKLPKSNKCIFLPRNKFDNYATNDRVVPYIDIIRNNIIELGGTVLNTYDLHP